MRISLSPPQKNYLFFLSAEFFCLLDVPHKYVHRPLKSGIHQIVDPPHANALDIDAPAQPMHQVPTNGACPARHRFFKRGRILGITIRFLDSIGIGGDGGFEGVDGLLVLVYVDRW